MPYWNLYWVMSDGLEDCFVVARNSRSAVRVECEMNGFEPEYARAEKLLRIPKKLEKKHNREEKRKDVWPWYARRSLFEDLDIPFREIDGVDEMLIGDYVYIWDDEIPFRARAVGKSALDEIHQNNEFREFLDKEELGWYPDQEILLTMFGMCVARCQEIEHYIANSFILGISYKNKHKYETINDMVAGWKKKTLGGLLRAIEDSYILADFAKAGLDAFLSMRNFLIHELMTNERFGIDSHWGQMETIAYLTRFNLASLAVLKTFRASFFYSMAYGYDCLTDGEYSSETMLSKEENEEANLFPEIFELRV